MRTRSLIISATLISALVLALAVIAMAADNPFVGTWKMNVSKSKTDPTPQSETLKIAPQDKGFKWIFDTVATDGKATNGVWLGKYDGKDCALKGRQDIDTVATRKINTNTLDFVLKNGGKVIGTGQDVVSKDGKILTITTKVKDEKGQDVTLIVIYDKQ